MARFRVLRKCFDKNLYYEGEIVDATAAEAERFRKNEHFVEIKEERSAPSPKAEERSSGRSPHRKIEVK